MNDEKFSSFGEFWPFYLKAHSNPINRRLHFIGLILVLISVAYVVWTRSWMTLGWAPLAGYGFAWTGHFLFEKNTPATFKHPLWSLMGDFKMCFLILTGKLRDS